MVGVYLDPEIPYPEARVAAALYIGGPIKYEIKKHAGLDDFFGIDTCSAQAVGVSGRSEGSNSAWKSPFVGML